MFVLEGKRLPIKVWLNAPTDLEEKCLQQAQNLSGLPFAVKHIALMPDTHMGYGMPVGGVLATEGVIIPNAVGVDIGCGMGFVQTNIPVQLLKEVQTGSGTLLQAMIGNILRNIPTGFAHRKDSLELSGATQALIPHHLVDIGSEEEHMGQNIFPSIYKQVGTLGGGNHFIELQENEEGMLAIMLHSGSRNVGKQVCDFFNKKAKEANLLWHTQVPREWDLAFLPVDTTLGKKYIAWMNFAMAFAMENREVMLRETKNIVFNMIKKYANFSGIETSLEVNAHHNYAVIENHFGQNVWVHRKGAISAREGQLGIIPGAMGSYSYIVEGKGEVQSFTSCSHGAGRKLSRTKALEAKSQQEVMEDLNSMGVVIGKTSMKDVAEEGRHAYKDIDTVINNESDLIKVVSKLKTVGVVKG